MTVPTKQGDSNSRDIQNEYAVGFDLLHWEGPAKARPEDFPGFLGQLCKPVWQGDQTNILTYLEIHEYSSLAFTSA